MKPFSLDWWWAQYNVAQGLFDYYAEISSYFDESILLDEKCIRDRLKATRYVDLRDYIQKRIEAKVIAQIKSESLYSNHNSMCKRGIHSPSLTGVCMICGKIVDSEVPK